MPVSYIMPMVIRIISNIFSKLTKLLMLFKVTTAGNESKKKSEIFDRVASI